MISVESLSALAAFVSMVFNAIRSFKGNISAILLVSLFIQQVGNMLVAINYTSYTLPQDSQRLYLALSVIAGVLTIIQGFWMTVRKISERFSASG